MALPPIEALQQWLGMPWLAQPRTGLIAIPVVAIILFLLFRARYGRSQAFINGRGERLPEIPSDSRWKKYLYSQQLSQSAQSLAGNTPYLIRSGPHQELVISQPDHVHEFYAHDYKRHSKPRNLNLGELFGCLMPGAIGGQYGDSWRKMRVHFDPPFAFHPTAQRIPRFTREIDSWISTLQSGEVNAGLTFKFIVFRVLAVHLYEDAFDDRMYWRMLELHHLHEEVSRALITAHWHDSQIWNYFSIGPVPIIRRFQREWREFNRTIIDDARRGQWTCPIEVIYQGVDPKHDMTEEAFLSTLSEILFNNVEISAQVLGTILTRLAAHPNIQRDLREEIQNCKGTGDAYLHKSDTLLHRVLLESMRFSPALWYSMPEKTAEDKSIGGYHIPAGTDVVIDTRRLNNDAITWGKNGDQFDPDRFLQIPSQSLRCGFMRFGVGAASGRCLGKNVADVVFKLTTIAVLERYNLEPLTTSGKRGAPNVRMVPLK